jgi:hypothetical protein
MRFGWACAALGALALAFALACNGVSNSSSQGSSSGTQGTAPAAPSGLMATAGNAQVSVAWNAVSGATTYHVKRSTTHGGPYSQIAAPSDTSYKDSGLTNGTTYYYVVSAVNSIGESANSAEVSATPEMPIAVPPVPTGLAAVAGNQQVALNWSASSGATGYHVKRSTTSGGPYTQVAAPSGTSENDTGLSDGTTYYYVVSAINSAGESANSAQVSATPVSSSSASVHVTVDVLSDRHPISPYVYGGAYPKDAPTITDSGLSVVRWGGNATSTYNWQLQTDNADNDWYFEDFNYSEIGDSSSSQFIQDVKTAGSNPLMTMVMLPWVAKTAETSVTQGGANNGHWSFSVAKYGAQCATDPYNTDAGDGLETDCSTALTADPNDAYVPLLDQPGSNDPAGSVYRNQWAAALATAFGSAPHFYDMDNEIDIWGSTHRDIHPNPSGYDELRDTYLAEARALKTWDPAAIRFGPVSCCWWFYWNGENNNDKAAHGGVDFLPWWLNEVYWQDQIAGTRSVDVVDIHAYPDTPDTSSFTTAQKQALATRIYRDYWDPTYVSESSSINQPWATQIQPNRTIPFRLPRMRAVANTIYPGTPLSVTEWSAEIVSASDFSTALGDADAYGILGRERVYLASRWTAPTPGNPNYLALKLFTNYDGAHHGFGTMSVSDTNNGNPDLFSSYAALNSTGTTLTLLVLNKDPQNTVNTQFALNNFTPSSVVSYTLAASAPTAITASSSHAWSSVISFAPYSATLMVITGAAAQTPASEWDLNPDVITAPVDGTVTLQPKITSGSANVTLTSVQSDSGISVTLTQPSITPTQNGTVTITAGNTAGFYHFTITGVDTSAVSQSESGWILVGNPPATLAKTGDGQTAAPGTQIALAVNLNAGSSGGSNQGATIFFTADSGTLSSQIVTTDSNGNAAVMLTLPSSPGSVHVTAQGQYELGHPVAVFTETAQ